MIYDNKLFTHHSVAAATPLLLVTARAFSLQIQHSII